MHRQSHFWRCVYTAKGSTHRLYSKTASETKDLYSTLGVARKATQSEIKQAYYTLTMKYHPDRNEDNPEAAVRFRQVTEAYEILGNVATRERYDVGGMAFVETTIPKARKPPVEHPVKYAQFFDKRNASRGYTKQRPTIGDSTDQQPSKEQKKPFEYSDPEVRKNHERMKSLALVVFFSLIFYNTYKNYDR